jgi:predicted Zn-ribbon and HTH transcriptional regulator
MAASNNQSKQTQLTELVEKIMEDLYKDRERDIISGRFGLNGKKKTLDAIGKEYGVTRERIRQLEKGIVIRLQVKAEEGKLAGFNEYEGKLAELIEKSGGVCTILKLSELAGEGTDPETVAKNSFITLISSRLVLVEESDHYNQSAVLASHYKSPSEALKEVDQIVNTLTENKKPISIAELKRANNLKESEEEIEAKVLVSTQTYQRKGLWGLKSWSSVNPKSIKDKIYIILSENKEPMHFSEIYKAIQEDKTFAQRNFTIQATHNELIRDPRYVLVGRGRYALKEWGHIEGTVEDVIEKVLKDGGNKPMHRDEIIRGVLRYRQVRETTIVLNLQSKPKFKRVATATFQLAE